MIQAEALLRVKRVLFILILGQQANTETPKKTGCVALLVITPIKNPAFPRQKSELTFPTPVLATK